MTRSVGHAQFRLTHFFFIYEQTLLNFSDIQLKQRIHFLHNPFFIHTAIRNVSLLSSINQAKPKLSISKRQLWLFDTFRTKRRCQVAWFHSTSTFQRVYFHFLFDCLAIYLQCAILFMEREYNTFHGTSNRDDSRTPQWNSSGQVFI